MLNASLTVLQSVPASHIKLWKPFTNYIIDYIDKHCSNVIFVAWGRFAFERMKLINQKKNYLLVSSHPSPLSYYKKFRSYPSFKDSKPFSTINNILKKNYIDW